MQKKKRIIGRVFLVLGLCIIGGFCFRQEVRANLWENSYVTFSPDGLAFTTNAGDRNIEWYSKGYTVYTGLESTLRTPEKGEHLYSVIETGNVRVGKWVVDNIGKCIHNAGISISNFHGVEFAKNYCQGYYYSGWWGYCADCNQKAAANYFYMSKAAAASLKELNMSLAYYYLCPWCTHLEQGVELMYHICKSISANQYSVRYHANFGTGTMPKSVHMYNNATIYEGKDIVPQKTLTPNSYTREGYEFAGWNTRQDGSGRYFSDGEEIYNLCSGEQENIILYAQWVKESDDRSEEMDNVDGISVDAYIKKIRESKSLAFKKGESGRLHIQAAGYVDRIEVIFPEEWNRHVPDLNKVYVYEAPAFMQIEELEFMVPLKVPDAQYTIVVKAYKGESMVEAKPQLLTITVSGSVLDEIRTRLR